jgi:CDGSH-type Zn-finger protein/ferredoxin
MQEVSIKFIKNGPLKIRIDGDKDMYQDIVFTKDGNSMDIKKNTILCVCGKSKEQPFCDGAHKAVGFSSENTLEDEIIQRYEGKDINIVFNRSICSGAGNCVRNFSKIYKNASENWIFPDEDSVEQVKKSIRSCPSGALSYETNKKTTLEKYDDIKINIIKNGPLNVKGKVALHVEKWSTNANPEKYSLCRCGASQNKPFCDYTHASLKAKSYTF